MRTSTGIGRRPQSPQARLDLRRGPAVDAEPPAQGALGALAAGGEIDERFRNDIVRLEAALRDRIRVPRAHNRLLIDQIGEVLRLPEAGMEENPVNLDPRMAKLAGGVHRLDGGFRRIGLVQRDRAVHAADPPVCSDLSAG